MTCPYCNKDLIEGYIYSPRTLSWTTGKLKTFSEYSLTKEGNVVLSETGLIHPAKVIAYNCSSCKKIIISYGDDEQQIQDQA